MLVKVILLVELLSVFLCVFRVYGQKPKIDVKGIIAFGSMFIIVDVVNYYSIPRNYVFLAYLVLIVYAILMFKEKFIKTVISIVLAIIVIAVVQFGTMLVLSIYPFENYNIRDVLGATVTLLVILFLIPYCKINKLRDAICRKHWLMYVIFCFIAFTILFAIISLKSTNELRIGLFLFGIPAIAIIVFLVIFWEMSIAKANKMEKEISILNSMQHSYKELLERVRLNQHGLNNHLSAVYSSHHTCKTYEQLVEAQQAYCNELYEENKYNNILLVQHNVLAGFLFNKILEIEKANIKYSYKINTIIEESIIPDYYLIEILGILIDNAIDASKENLSESEIYFEITKDDLKYNFTVRNVYREVSYKEIEEWFDFGKTSKEKGNGIGLYRVKQVCKEWKCDIKCSNEIYDERNWVTFVLCIDKKEDVV